MADHRGLSGHRGLGGIPLVFGGNIFGWTVDRDRSFELLDAFYAAGGRMIDTADGYSAWVPGNKGGESETIIGQWLERRGVRSDMRIASKTGMGGPPGGLAPDKVAAACQASLERLRTDYLDLYYAHRDDPETPHDEVAQGFDALVRAGKARELGASNFTAERLASALDAAARIGATPYTVLQNEFNLVTRSEYEGAVQQLVVKRGMASLPFYGLAAGFLSGKFRSAGQWAGSPRAHALNAAADRGGFEVLKVMDTIAAATGATLPQIALAWLLAQPGVAAPLASATSTVQLAELVGAVSLRLSPAQLARLGAAGQA